MVDLGLNPGVGPTRGSWSQERSEVDDGGGTSEREELRGTDESHVGGTLVDYPNAETQPSYRVYMSKSYGGSGVRPGGTYDQEAVIQKRLSMQKEVQKQGKHMGRINVKKIISGNVQMSKERSGSPGIQ